MRGINTGNILFIMSSRILMLVPFIIGLFRGYSVHEHKDNAPAGVVCVIIIKTDGGAYERI
jgi:hypothetical protein